MPTRAVGIDVSPDMLAIARDRLLRGEHPQCPGAAGRYLSPAVSQRQRAAPVSMSCCSTRCCITWTIRAPRSAEAARVMAPGGRLLIADFTPHKQEFLRDEFAHRRLGFSDREVEGWFSAAGLASAGSETIAPRAAGEKLTVKLWLATAKSPRQKRSSMSLANLITDPSPLQVSFEFSPPKTDGGGSPAVAGDPAAGAAARQPLSRSPMAQAGRRASAPMPPSSALSRKPASSRRRI